MDKQTSLRFTHSFLSLIYTLGVFFFIITFSIGLAIHCRSFYYMHIEKLNLPEKSGFTETEIREAYDAVLDYLTLPGADFSTGVMSHSQSGKEHFSDCKWLFTLNTAVFISSSIILLLLSVLRRTKKLCAFKLGKRSSFFWGATFALVIPLTAGILASSDFDRAFVIFHKIFFPGKDNWIFDYNTDEIIRILPQDFFMNCAILIGASIFILSISLIVAEILFYKYKKRNCFFQ